MAFRRSKIWFTNLFASLCRRPQFLGSLQLILCSLHVISHTEDHERCLEIKRMEKVDPKSRIISGPNIWPLVVIDNLDTKQKTFKHNNYYNEGRTSFHVVLRICFFFILPLPICEIVGEESMIYEKKTIFLIYQEIIKHIPKGTLVPPPKVVILEAGGKPDDDQGIYESIEMFLDEINTADAKAFGAKYLANFQKIVDYRATSRLLELIWVGVGMALSIFTTKHQVSIDELLENPPNINSLKEPLWKLTTDLLDLFENFNSNMTHHLIEKVPELTTDGFNSLFNSYDIGKRRMETLLNQEVYGTEEINTISRRSTNVKVYKYEKLVEIYSKKKEKGKACDLEENIEATERPSNFNNNPIDLSVPIEEGESSNKRRRTTEHEHSILDPLVEMDTKPTKDQINRAIEKTRWDRKRVLGYVNKQEKKDILF
nr:15424_t:CDS:2 [Entrophospora candida]